MIREALAYLFEKATREARRAGYVHEQIALLARHRRHRRSRAPHLARTRDFIARIAQETPGRVAVVLGSGGLLDVPLEALAERYAEILLVDVFHPRIARRAAKRYPNVRLVTHDLLAEAAPGASPLRLDGWRAKVPAPDLVISANLLSQLPILPLQRTALEPEAALAWMKEVIAAHLVDLTAGPGVACVVTEKQRRRYDREGREIDSHDGLAGAVLPAAEESWVWEIAPFGEIERETRTAVEVRAFRLPAKG